LNYPVQLVVMGNGQGFSSESRLSACPAADWDLITVSSGMLVIHGR